MKESEIISVAWLAFFALFALVVFVFSDRKQNQAWIERMGAFIFAAVTLTALGAAYAPKFITHVLGLPWYTGSPVNITVIIAGILIGWAVFAVGIEWLMGLTIFTLMLGGISWTVNSFI